MPKFSKRSLERLKTCHPELQKLFLEIVESFDCTILEGHRNKEKQDKAFADGKSTKKFPCSQHNRLPSRAVDVAPYPIEWDNLERFYYFAGFVRGTAYKQGITIRWGGDWDSDTKVHDQKLMDLPHYEVIL